MAELQEQGKPTVVFVHGAFVDGSGWQGVYQILKKNGYQARIVQNPTITLADDVAAVKSVIDLQDGPVILVGHSYGGMVITEAGTHPKVAALVYVSAFVPDAGESVQSLVKEPPPDAPPSPILPPHDGFLTIDRARFHQAFAADLDAETAAFLADSQVPWGLAALSGEISEPAWKSRPCWSLIPTEDQTIPPDAQRLMSGRAGSTVIEVPASHAVYISQPDAVATLIEMAAKEIAAPVS